MQRCDADKGCQRGSVAAGADEVSSGDEGAADAAVDGRTHEREVAVQLHRLQCRLGGGTPGPRLGVRSAAAFELLGSDGALGMQLACALGFAGRQRLTGACQLQLGAGACQRGVEGTGVDLEQRLAGAHQFALAEQHGLDQTRHARLQLDPLRRLDAPHLRGCGVERCGHDGGHRHRWRLGDRRCCGLCLRHGGLAGHERGGCDDGRAAGGQRPVHRTKDRREDLGHGRLLMGCQCRHARDCRCGKVKQCRPRAVHDRRRSNSSSLAAAPGVAASDTRASSSTKPASPLAIGIPLTGSPPRARWR